MQPDSRQQNRLCATALEAEQAGRLPEAARLYRQAIACDKSNPTPYLFYGFALERLGMRDAAAEAWSFGADLDPRLINAWRAAGVDAEIGQRSKAANDCLRRHFTALHRHSIEAFLRDNPAASIERIAAAIWCQTHESDFEYRQPGQRPHLFYVPDLPAIPVYSRAHTPWQDDLEAAMPDIRAEFMAAQQDAAAEATPYLDAGAASLGEDWQPLANSLNWGSFHLFKKGEANPRLVERFPKTLDALAAIPLVRTPGGPSEILFSVLAAKQSIPPHFGVANTDITVHLPIVTVPDAGIRVVETVYAWEQGKVFAFDDSFEHESWNRSDEPRVNLLFEAWHPDLSDDEQQAITATFAARKRWAESRRLDHPIQR